MSNSPWIRAARRAIGLRPLPEYPQLEALLAEEADKLHCDFGLLIKILPPLFAGIGIAFSVVAAVLKTPWALFGLVPTAVVAGGTWMILDYLNRTVSKTKMRIRAISEELNQRYGGFAHLTGIEPALSPLVGPILDEAAGIYRKHCTEPDTSNGLRGRAQQAIEDATARMLQLAKPESPSAQEAELMAGWAMPLLEEMRATDRALDRNQALASAQSGDPLAGLREARQELQVTEKAFIELDQH